MNVSRDIKLFDSFPSNPIPGGFVSLCNFHSCHLLFVLHCVLSPSNFFIILLQYFVFKIFHHREDFLCSLTFSNVSCFCVACYILVVFSITNVTLLFFPCEEDQKFLLGSATFKSCHRFFMMHVVIPIVKD